MARVSLDETRKHLTGLVGLAAHGERIIICRGRKRLAALVPVEDATFMEDREDRLDVEAAKKVLREDKENVPLEQVKRELAARWARKRTHR